MFFFFVDFIVMELYKLTSILAASPRGTRPKGRTVLYAATKPTAYMGQVYLLHI